MLKRVMSAAGGGARRDKSLARAENDEKVFEMVSGTLSGRPTLAIVNRQGAAIAIEVGQDRPEIVRGIAAGAILSELKEAVSNLPPCELGADSAQPTTLTGATALGHASRSEASEMIESLPDLTAPQRAELRGVLGLS